jgi:predicted Zn finger-like uncharacterized protein
MIAACPKCHTRYRVQQEQLGPDGARLRCSSCSAVFRVRSPAAAAPPSPTATTPDRSVLGEAARGGTAHASGAAEGRGARSEPKASEAHQDAGVSQQVHRNDGLEGRRSDPPAQHRIPSPVATPDAPEPGPSYDRERLVVVAHADPDTAKAVAEALEGWGLETLVAHDGVEAMLAIQRTLPRAVVLDAALPKMFGFQVCEIVKRNESLRETRVVLVGAIHKEERYRRAPRDLYGADVYVEPPDLPDALLEILTRFGLPIGADAATSGAPARPDAPYGHIARGGAPARDSRTEPFLEEPGPTEAPVEEAARGGTALASAAAVLGRGARSEPKASGAHQDAGVSRQVHRNEGLEGPRSDPSAQLRPPMRAPAPAKPTPAPPPAANDPLAAERAKAERLARIIVSDIVLYNPEKFDAAARSGGDVVAAMRDELDEARTMFRERVDAQVRSERDHLADELVRAAKARSGR